MSKRNAGGNLRRFYIVFGAVALVGIGVLGYAVGSDAMGGAATEPVELEGTDDLLRLRELAVPISKGEADAPVTIIEFGDYLCGHCATFSLRIRPLVEENLVDTGQARLLFFDFPLNPETGTFLAARAARCAGDQGKYWEYHDQLFRSQYTWGAERDKLGVFQDFAEQLGLNAGEFRGCLNSDRHAEEVTANRELAHALGLNSTPSVLVGTSNGGMSRRLPDYSFESIQQAVQSLLGG